MIPNTGKIKSKSSATQLSSYSLDIKGQPQIPTSTLAPNYAHYSKRLYKKIKHKQARVSSKRIKHVLFE